MPPFPPSIQSWEVILYFLPYIHYHVLPNMVSAYLESTRLSRDRFSHTSVVVHRNRHNVQISSTSGRPVMRNQGHTSISRCVTDENIVLDIVHACKSWHSIRGHCSVIFKWKIVDQPTSPTEGRKLHARNAIEPAEEMSLLWPMHHPFSSNYPSLCVLRAAILLQQSHMFSTKRIDFLYPGLL